MSTLLLSNSHWRHKPAAGGLIGIIPEKSALSSIVAQLGCKINGLQGHPRYYISYEEKSDETCCGAGGDPEE
jgi:hypothetical protein